MELNLNYIPARGAVIALCISLKGGGDIGPFPSCTLIWSAVSAPQAAFIDVTSAVSIT